MKKETFERMSKAKMSDRQALLVIDVQNEYFTGSLPVTFPEGSLCNILRAMDDARGAGIPIAVIQHAASTKDSPTFRKGSEEWQLHPGVKKRKRDILIEKTLPWQLYWNGS